MIKRHGSRIALIASMAMLGTLALTSAAFGVARSGGSNVVASWAFEASHVNSSVAPTFQYVVHGEPSRSTFQLERQFGTAHVWKAVAAVTVVYSSGTGTAPGVPMGRYVYRGRLLHDGRVLWTSGARSLFSYGNVVLATLCNAPNVVQGTCGEGTVQIASHVFTYELTGDECGCEPPQWGTPIQFPPTSCRTLVLHFGLQDGDQSGEVANVQVIQSTNDPEAASTTEGTLGRLEAPLDGGAWYLENNATSGDVIYYSGYASCWSANGEK